MIWPVRRMRTAACADAGDPEITLPCAALTQAADPDVDVIPAFKASYAWLFADVLAGKPGSVPPASTIRAAIRVDDRRQVRRPPASGADAAVQTTLRTGVVTTRL